jgi:hypothetical protein
MLYHATGKSEEQIARILPEQIFALVRNGIFLGVGFIRSLFGRDFIAGLYNFSFRKFSSTSSYDGENVLPSIYKTDEYDATKLDSPHGDDASPVLQTDIHFLNESKGSVRGEDSGGGGPTNTDHRTSTSNGPPTRASGGPTSTDHRASTSTTSSTGGSSTAPSTAKTITEREQHKVITNPPYPRDPRYRLYELDYQRKLEFPFDFYEQNPKISYKVEANRPVQVILCDIPNYQQYLLGNYYESITPKELPTHLSIFHVGENVMLPHGGRWYLIITNWNIGERIVFHYDLQLITMT